MRECHATIGALFNFLRESDGHICHWFYSSAAWDFLFFILSLQALRIHGLLHSIYWVSSLPDFRRVIYDRRYTTIHVSGRAMSVKALFIYSL